MDPSTGWVSAGEARTSRAIGGSAVPCPLLTPCLPPRERMEAMEKQIASLTGLVQSALLRGSEAETPR